MVWIAAIRVVAAMQDVKAGRVYALEVRKGKAGATLQFSKPKLAIPSWGDRAGP